MKKDCILEHVAESQFCSSMELDILLVKFTQLSICLCQCTWNCMSASTSHVGYVSVLQSLIELFNDTN